MMRSRFILLGIAAAGLAIRLALFPGTQISDDLTYIRTAHRIAHGEYDVRKTTDIKEHRLGLLLPMAAVQRVLGTGEFTGTIVAIASWAGVCAFLYLWTRRLLGERAALLACAFSAIVPLDVLMSMTMFPEVPVAVVNLGALLILDVGIERKRPALWFAAGILVGLGYFVKESSVFWVPSMLLWIFWKRAGWKPAVVFVGSVAVIFVAELALFGLWAGDPLHRYKIGQASYVPEWTPTYHSTGRIVQRLLIDLPVLFVHPVFAGLFLFAIPAAIWAWRTDRARMAGPLWLFLGLYLTFNFFPGRIWPYMPNGVMYRYLYPFLIPTYLILAWACDRAIGRKWLAPVAGLFLVAQAWMNYVVHVDADNRAICARKAARHVSGRVHADPGTAQVVELVSGFRAKVLVGSDDYRPGDWVIVNEQMDEFRRTAYGEEPRVVTPRDSWVMRGTYDARGRFRLRTMRFLQPSAGARVYQVP